MLREQIYHSSLVILYFNTNRFLFFNLVAIAHQLRGIRTMGRNFNHTTFIWVITKWASKKLGVVHFWSLCNLEKYPAHVIACQLQFKLSLTWHSSHEMIRINILIGTENQNQGFHIDKEDFGPRITVCYSLCIAILFIVISLFFELLTLREVWVVSFLCWKGQLGSLHSET